MLTDADDPVIGENGADTVPTGPVWTPAMEEAVVAELEERLKNGPPPEPLTPEQEARKKEWEAIPVDDAPAPRSREELWPIALKVAQNDIFTSRHLRADEQDLVTMVFVPLALMDDKSLKYVTTHAGMVYEEYSKALPRGINGFPMFVSFRTVYKAEWDLFRELVAEAEKRVAALKETP